MPKSLTEQQYAFADLIIKVGLNLQVKQRLLIRASTENADFTRIVAEKAYQAGSPEVTVLWNDDILAKQRLEYAPDSVLSSYPDFLAQANNEASDRGDAILSIRSSDPELYQGIQGNKIALAEKASRSALMPFFQKISSSAVNWCLVSVPAKAWAAKVFPNDTQEQQLTKLWHAILKTVRTDQENPEAAWQTHLDKLEERRAYLDEKKYQSLHYKGDGTDLTIGLIDNHLWMGGIQPTQTGIIYVANLPTEEVFTMPHKQKVNGTVSSSLPLSHNGSLIDKFSLTFKDGKVTQAKAEKGDEALQRILNTDEGARHLGEVALVPHSSPISQSGILFYDTLFDENAASHLALGRAYPFTIKDGTTWSQAEAAKKGVNNSLTHVDFMIGNQNIDIDGTKADGSTEPVMRSGEFVF